MEKSIFNITEYFENQDIDFQGITSFKVQNNGECTVDINAIPVYPGETIKLVEEDGAFCDFNLKSVFTEEGKLPKFKAIYKQLETEAASTDNLHQNYNYAVTLHDYQVGDIVEFSQNKSGNTVLIRSFDGGVTWDEANNIDLGYVEANQIIRYDRGGSLDTNAIKFRNEDSEEDSEIFAVSIDPDAWVIAAHYQDICDSGYFAFTSNKSGVFDIELFDMEYWSYPSTVNALSGIEVRTDYGIPIGASDGVSSNGTSSVFYSIKRVETGEIKYFSFQTLSDGVEHVAVETSSSFPYPSFDHSITMPEDPFEVTLLQMAPSLEGVIDFYTNFTGQLGYIFFDDDANIITSGVIDVQKDYHTYLDDYENVNISYNILNLQLSKESTGEKIFYYLGGGDDLPYQISKPLNVNF